LDVFEDFRQAYVVNLETERERYIEGYETDSWTDSWTERDRERQGETETDRKRERETDRAYDVIREALLLCSKRRNDLELRQ
jgi:hypothetical protein